MSNATQFKIPAFMKISIANAYIQKSVQDGILKRISGFSGHHVYQPVSK